MVRQRGGSIVNVSSNTALFGNTGISSYGPAKAGMISFSKHLAVAYGPYGIRHLDSRAVYDLATHPEIVDRMACLYGPDLLLWRTNFFVKNRGSKAIPWHQDFNYWPLEPPVIISAWIVVDPSTRQNGNLQVIPGLHRSIVPHVEATTDVQSEEMADAGYYDPRDLTDLEMQPGEFILFNERTLHHSEASHSDLRRIGLAVRAIIPIERQPDRSCHGKNEPGVLIRGGALPRTLHRSYWYGHGCYRSTCAEIPPAILARQIPSESRKGRTQR